MKEFCVELTATACVGNSIYIRAETAAEAAAIAQSEARNGNVNWRYQAVDDSTIEVLTVSAVAVTTFQIGAA